MACLIPLAVPAHPDSDGLFLCTLTGILEVLKNSSKASKEPNVDACT